MADVEVRVRLVEGTTGLISARSHTVVVDRTSERGGADLGFTGGELLLAAQAGCFLTTFAGAAQARGITVHRLDAIVGAMRESAPSRYSGITIDVDVDADASESEIEKLIAIAENGCTVANTLRAGASIAVSRRAPAVAVSS